MVINKFPNREVYEKIKAKGSLGADDVNVLEDYPGPELPDSTAADAGKLLQVGADGNAAWGDKLPTALKNPNALTFTGAATGTYDGSAALTINIPAGGSSGSGSGGALKAMSAVARYIGIPATDLPENGVVWMCFGSGDSTELYTGTVTIQDAGIAVNDMLVITNGTVNQLNQVAWVSDGLAVYGLSASDYRGVWQQVGAGGGSPINWRGEYSAQTAYNRLDAVSYNGSSYVFVSATSIIGAIPGIDEEWQLLAQKGDSGESLSLSMTSAAVGQIAKISAVDANGAPTAWEPVDMPSGGGSGEFRVIRQLILSEQTDRVDITVDDDGKTFELSEIYVSALVQSYNDTNEQVTFLPNGGWTTLDPFITSVTKTSKSSDTWKNQMNFHAVFALGGELLAYQLSAGSGNLTSKFMPGRAVLTKVSIVGKFAVGCKFTVIGR